MDELSLEEIFVKIKESFDEMDGNSIADIINSEAVFDSIVSYTEDGQFTIDKEELPLDELYDMILESLESSDGLVTEDLMTAACSCSCDYKGDGVWTYEEPFLLNSI